MTDQPTPESTVKDLELTPEQWKQLQTADALFDQMCEDRYAQGKRDYGAYTFLQMPTLEMAMEEIVDLSNYARFTFIKVYMIQCAIVEAQNRAMSSKSGGFIPTANLLGANRP